MTLKRLVSIIVLVMMHALATATVASASSPQGVYKTIHHETFESVEGALHMETFYWANHATSGVKTSPVIGGDKSLVFDFDAPVGTFVTLGGTSVTALALLDATYRISLDILASDADFLNIRTEQSQTWETYHEVIIDPLTGTRLDGDGLAIDPLDGELITIDPVTSVITLSFVFDARKTHPSNLVFDTRASGADPLVVIDNVTIEKHVPPMDFRTVVIDNFDNASGEVWQTSIFFLNDDEGTTGTFPDTPGLAVENRSLVYGINKTGWDILGGTQGQELSIIGGHTYRISYDLILDDVSHFVMKVRRIADDHNIYEMYVNDNGQRLPGSMPSNNVESVINDNGIIHISFEFQSLLSDAVYVFLEAQSVTEGGTVTLDNFHVEEEIVSLSKETYTVFEEITFDSVPDGTDPLTDAGLTDAGSGKSHILTTDMAIRGTASLMYDDLARFQWNTLLQTDAIDLSDDLFKIHMKGVFEGILNVKMGLSDASGNIIHEMFFNAITLKRTQTYGRAYLDQGVLTLNRGTVYVDYLLPELESGVSHTWTLSVYPQTSDGYVVIDDITFMKRAGDQTIDETLPDQPDDPADVENTIPTGMDDTFMTQSTLKGSGTITLVIISAASLLSLGLGALGVVLVIKKVTVVAKKAVFSSLLGLLSVGLPLFMFFGCAEFDKTVDDVIATPTATMADYHHVYPEKLSGNLQNPGMGWVTLEEPTYGGHPDMGTSGPLPEVSNVSLSTSWARIEVEEGVYDWTLMDQIIDYYTARGKRINFRIVTDSLMLPNTYSGTPTWLFDKYNVPYEVHNYTDPGPVRTYRVVDTRNADYKHHLSLFLEALAERYKDNRMIDVVEIRGWGNWGEWHSGFTYPTMENRINALADIIDAYVDAFKETGKLLVLSAAWDPHHMPYDAYEDYISFSAFDYLWRLDNTTFRRDSGGNLMNYPTDERLMSDAFRSGKRVPLLGEYSSGVEHAYNATFGFDLLGGIDDILFKMRPNYSTVLGWVNSNVARVVNDGNSILWERGNEKLGYRLAVDEARFPKQAKQDSDMDIMLSFSNSAVGRFWYEHPLRISLLDGDNNEVHAVTDTSFDARTFVLGETTRHHVSYSVPDTLPDGSYTVAVSIVDETGMPSIRMGMAGEIGDSMMYALGTVGIGQSKTTPAPLHDTMTIEETRDYAFSPKSTYAVTFDYTPHFDVADYHFADDNGYVFALTSQEGGAGATVGHTKWQDVSQERGTKTVIVSTHDFDDYVMDIVSEGYGEIDIHDVRIEKLGGYFEHFEDYDFTDYDALYLPSGSKDAYLTTDNNIKGQTSVELTSNRRGDFEMLSLDTNVHTLEPNTNYTVTFQFLSTSLVGKGGYMFMNLVDTESDSRTRIGEWYERTDRGVTTKTFNFTTGSSGKQTIAWGVRNGGSYVIDDITLTKNPTGTIISGIPYGHPQNVVPEFDLPAIGETEGFEALSFNATSFEWGQFGWGQITYDPRLVISGGSSLMGQIEEEALDNEWFEFARSKPGAITLEANTTYNVTFDYRIVSNPINNGFFYVLMRDLSVGLPSDAGFAIIPNATQNDLMVTKQMSLSITTGNHDNYQFIFGMHMLGEIVIDNVIIEEN
jgi:hypothetical protein